MLEYCSEHGEVLIVWQANDYDDLCPMCDLEKQLDNACDRVDDLSDELEALKDTINGGLRG